MKKCWFAIVLAVFLTGCGVQETFETISDSYEIPAMAEARQIQMTIPKNAAVLTLESGDTGTLYLCDNYTVTVQTLQAGDLDRTLRAVTGYSRDELTVIQTLSGQFTRYDLVWVSAGEGGDQVGRAAILDDGSYHYILTAMAEADQAEALSEDWDQLFHSFWAL